MFQDEEESEAAAVSSDGKKTSEAETKTATAQTEQGRALFRMVDEVEARLAGAYKVKKDKKAIGNVSFFHAMKVANVSRLCGAKKSVVRTDFSSLISDPHYLIRLKRIKQCFRPRTMLTDFFPV